MIENLDTTEKIAGKLYEVYHFGNVIFHLPAAKQIKAHLQLWQIATEQVSLDNKFITLVGLRPDLVQTKVYVPLNEVKVRYYNPQTHETEFVASDYIFDRIKLTMKLPSIPQIWLKHGCLNLMKPLQEGAILQLIPTYVAKEWAKSHYKTGK